MEISRGVCMGLRSFILKRSIFSVVLVFVVIALNFLIFEMMPGSVLDSFIQPGKTDPATAIAQMERFGLDRPPHERFIIYVRNLLTGEFGVSFITMKPVAEEIGERLMNTLLLMGISTVLSIGVGVILGVIAAHKRGGKYDSISGCGSLTTYSLPSFWMGMLLLLA